MVRIKSILAKLKERHPDISAALSAAGHGAQQFSPAFSVSSERELALSLTRFSHAVSEAQKKDAPSLICSYIYEISNKFNVFYHDKKILAEENKDTLRALIALITLTLNVLDICINILGFRAPDKM